MQTQNRSRVTLHVDSIYCGVWDAVEGGGVEGEESKYKPGGMADEIDLGSSPSRSNITLSRIYDEFLHGLAPWLESRVGAGVATVTRQYLTKDKAAVGAPRIYTGTFQRADPPEHDSTSSDPARMEAEVSTNFVAS